MSASKFRPHTFGMVNNGHLVAGELNGLAKLTAPVVLRARLENRRGVDTTALAQRYGVAESTVRRACQGITWRHLA